MNEQPEIIAFQIVVRTADGDLLLDLTDKQKQLLLNFVPVACGGVVPAVKLPETATFTLVN